MKSRNICTIAILFFCITSQVTQTMLHLETRENTKVSHSSQANNPAAAISTPVPEQAKVAQSNRQINPKIESDFKAYKQSHGESFSREDLLKTYHNELATNPDNQELQSKITLLEAREARKETMRSPSSSQATSLALENTIPHTQPTTTSGLDFNSDNTVPLADTKTLDKSEKISPLQSDQSLQFDVNTNNQTTLPPLSQEIMQTMRNKIITLREMKENEELKRFDQEWKIKYSLTPQEGEEIIQFINTQEQIKEPIKEQITLIESNENTSLQNKIEALKAAKNNDRLYKDLQNNPYDVAIKELSNKLAEQGEISIQHAMQEVYRNPSSTTFTILFRTLRTYFSSKPEALAEINKVENKTNTASLKTKSSSSFLAALQKWVTGMTEKLPKADLTEDQISKNQEKNLQDLWI